MDKLFFYMDQKIKEAVHVFFYIDGASRLLCVSGGFSHAETRARSCAARFCFEKRSKGRDVGVVSRSRLFYLTAIALFMQVVFKRAQIVPFDFFQAFLASSGVQALFYLIKRKDMGVKAGLAVLVSFLFLFF
ncbi:hypothetical protein [Bacillus sp. FSL K6-3149]|uniref:hypothetical protein n=1 Tax=Bacillus sp. FSL K6-3149 TaxID=2921488 RepID=UPI00315A7667